MWGEGFANLGRGWLLTSFRVNPWSETVWILTVRCWIPVVGCSQLSQASRREAAVLEGLVVVFGLASRSLALVADVADDSQGGDEERHRTENEDAIQNSHRGEDNKIQRREAGGRRREAGDGRFRGRAVRRS